MQNKYIIIGSNSFSGSNFIDYLLLKNLKVIGVSRSNNLSDIYLKYKNNKNYKKNFKFYKIDINKNLNSLIKIIYEFKPNIIINYAAQGMVEESWKKPIDWYNTNLISQVKLFEKLKNIKFIDKFIQFTTPEVYGNTNKKIKESNYFLPSTPYANSRAACDYHLINLNREFNFPVIFTRTANVYGPCQRIYRIIPKTIISIKKNKLLNLDGGGNSKRSFIHINDVNKALFKICKNGKIGNTYHISTKKLVTIRFLVKKICQIMNVKFEDVVKISPERIGKDKNYFLDTQKINDTLNWTEEININDGVKDVIDWVNQNSSFLLNEQLNYIHKK